MKYLIAKISWKVDFIPYSSIFIQSGKIKVSSKRYSSSFYDILTNDLHSGADSAGF